MFSIHFHLRIRLLAWLLSSLFTLPFIFLIISFSYLPLTLCITLLMSSGVSGCGELFYYH